MKRKNKLNKSDSVKVLRKLNEFLTCPICYDNITSNILQCKNGHVFCETCTKKMDACGFCKYPISTRNLILEQLLSKHNVSCSHHNCSFICKHELIKNHEKTCEYRPHICPMESCCKMIYSNEIKEHFINHKNKML